MNTAVLSSAPAAQAPEAPVRIRFENVSVDFPTSHGPMRVLDDVSFEIRNGEFVSIIGPSWAASWSPPPGACCWTASR